MKKMKNIKKKTVIFTSVLLFVIMIFSVIHVNAEENLIGSVSGISSKEANREEIVLKEITDEDEISLTDESIVGAVTINSNVQMSHTKDEIKAKYKEANPAVLEETMFSTKPVTEGPNYEEGYLTPAASNEVLDWINFYRYLAGVDNVGLNSATMNLNGAGAVLLKASNFAHIPEKPNDMSQDFYNKAIQGTSFPTNFGDYANAASGNIAAGTTLIESIDGWISEISSVSVGNEHRFSLLSPNAILTSFGYAPGKGKDYTNFSTLTMFESYETELSDIHTWPPAGFSPVEVSDYRQKWSMTFDKKYLITPSIAKDEVVDGETIHRYYLNPKTTIIQISHNGEAYTITSEIEYNELYNAISFDIPSSLKEALKDNNSNKYKADETLLVRITSRDITKDSEMISFTYNIDLFEASAKEYVQVQAVLLDDKELTLAAGTTKKIGATVVPSDATNPEITWTTTDSDVVSVDQEGNVVALKQGQAVIRATAEDRYEECLVNVYKDVESIELEQVVFELLVNDKAKINYTVLPEDATYKSVTFEVGDSNIVSVSNTGEITALAVGETDVTVVSSNVKITAKVIVRVLDEKIDITSLAFEEFPNELYTGYYKKLNMIYEPEDATSGMVYTYTSSDNNVAVINQYGELRTIGEGTTTLRVENQHGIYAEKTITVKQQETEFKYRTHVQNVGWQAFVEPPKTSGTEGKGYRLEGIILDLNTNLEGSLEYTTHVQNIGWQDYVQNKEMSGTEGKGLRLEGIKIRLTGELTEYYDVYYRVHVQNIGWLSWAKNDQTAGSSGYGYRLEGIQIALVGKGDEVPEMDPPAQNTKYFQEKVNVIYQTHTENIGWQPNVRNGAIQGAPGQHLRIEGIKIKTESTTEGSIRYATHIQNIGWLDYVDAGVDAGTQGRALRLEAIKIELTGELAEKYDVYYRIYVEGKDWLGWAKNGEEAGSTGYGLKLEGIQIKLVTKGGAAPGSTDTPCYNREISN